MSTESKQMAGEAQTQNNAESGGSAGNGGSGVDYPTGCAAINSAGRWLDMEVEVLELWDYGSVDAIAQGGLLGDSSGYIRFVTWASSDLDALEEGQSYALKSVVTGEFDGNYTVKLNSETEIAEITGPAAEREQLAAGGDTAVALETIDSADNWIDVKAEVDQLWEPSTDSIAQAGLLSSRTGSLKFVSWITSDLPDLEEGETYKLQNVVTDEYEGRYSVKLTTETEIEHLDGVLAVTK
jgi:replication factor A1